MFFFVCVCGFCCVFCVVVFNSVLASDYLFVEYLLLHSCHMSKAFDQSS